MSKKIALGVIIHEQIKRRPDFLYRISLKCLIRNADGGILVVKETGRDWWDLPGGGMEHGETIKSAIAREMKEEVNLEGDFAFEVLDVDEPAPLQPYNFWQLRLIFAVVPHNMTFSVGDDGDAIAFKDPQVFKDSKINVERRIYRYSLKLASAA